MEHHLETPCSETAVQALNAGDTVKLSGWIYTARDAVHQYLAQGGTPPVSLAGNVIYHCGPVVVSQEGQWKVMAAGPTTSAREEPYMPTIIRAFGLRAVIGKGGMGEETRKACQENNCVYLHAVGGAAQQLAASVVEVGDVYLQEKFGKTEAIWALYVENFPAFVTMDTHGKDVHEDVKVHSLEKLNKMLEEEGVSV